MKEVTKKIEIEFEIKRVIYQNADTSYKVLKVEIKKHPEDVPIPTAEEIVVGNFPHNYVFAGDVYRAIGKWVDSGTHGIQFRAESIIKVMPETEKGIIELLKRNVRGVGPQTAKKIVEKFGLDTLDIIENTPEKLLEVPGITKKKAEIIAQEIGVIQNFQYLHMRLSPYGFLSTEVQKIYEEMGAYAYIDIEDDPYIVCRKGISTFKNVDRIAKNIGFPPNSRKRIKQGIIEYISYNLNNMGNLFIYKMNILEKLSDFLNTYGGYNEKVELTEEEISEALDELLESKKIIEEKDKYGLELIYPKFYYDVENYIVHYLQKIIEEEGGILKTKDIDIYIEELDEEGIEVGEKQKEAIRMALSSRISILSGGPGTGKTYTANLIIKAIKKYRPSAVIELAAPTGKAAKRMTEMTGMEAKTIHRLIGLNGLEEEQSLTDLKTITADYLIIDEASMIDAYVFYCLLSCISKYTNILIIGDYQQLPSVGPGLILRDLIDSKKIPTTILTEIYRQAEDSQIITNSHKIINGNKDLSLNNNKGDFYIIETKNQTTIKNTLMKCIERLLKTGFSMDDIQVLSVMNKGDLGAKQLNKEIQRRFNPAKENIPEIKVGVERVFRLGDRVIQTENNYELEVFNGEVGKIIEIKSEPIREVTVDFGDKVITYVDNAIQELTLAYAITVHKSQGSEFGVVIMPVHKSQSILLHRNVIYTAWTRAKNRVVVIGDREELNKGIDRIDNTIRNSRIKEKLIGDTGEEEELPF